MSKGQNLGLALIASAVMAAPAYGQAYGAQGERIVCTRDFNTGAVVCPQPQQQQVYVPTGPAQQRPQVVAEQPNPVVTAVVGTVLAVGVAALLSRGNGGGHHHYGSPGHHVFRQPVQQADIYYPDGYGCMRTARGSVRCPGY